jgi:hypothetical protein
VIINIVALREVLFRRPAVLRRDGLRGRSDLKAWCERSGGAAQVSLRAKLEIVAQIADALQAAR